jgi:hypothetical protein
LTGPRALRPALLVAFAAATTTPGCASRAAAAPAGQARPRAPTPTGRLATWVWDEATVLSSEARRDLLAFARRQGVDALFVHAAKDYDGDRGFEALAALVREAARQGASVTLVGGDPAWSLPAHSDEALAFVGRAARLEARLAAAGLPRASRVLLDVEPYLLPEWRAAPERAAGDYLGMVRALRQAGRGVGLDVWHTIPFWFPTISVAGRPLDGLVLDEASGIVVMAYRDRTADVRALAEPLLAAGAKRGRPVVVAVETMCIDPPRVTFCGQTGAALAGALADLGRAFGPAPAFAGLAVHQYASWAKLVASAPPVTSEARAP